MLYIVLAYLMLFAALTNSVCLNNASFFFLFKYFLCQGYELSGEIALKNNHYYYYYYYFPIFCISELDVKKQLNNNNELFYRENTNDNIKKLNNFLTLQTVGIGKHTLQTLHTYKVTLANSLQCK